MIFIATCGIWKISSNLKQVINYISNEEKTIKQNDFIKELHNTINNSDNNEEVNHFITGINCNPKTAFKEMQITKESFSKVDGILGYHAYQSFPKGEVSTELSHQIGVELANEMWGDRFQVFIATHTNTENVHNHFVINSVSFLDGKKCEYSRSSYAELRHLNDSICQEYGLSVLEEKKTRKNINYENYLKKNLDGKLDYYSLTKLDIDYCINEAVSYKDFLNLLRDLDYTVYERYDKLSVKGNSYKKIIRIERRFGEEYSINNIKKRIEDITKNRESGIIYNHITKNIIKKKINKKYHGLQGLYHYYCYLLKIYPSNIRRIKLSPSMREDSKKLDELSNEAIFLVDNNIITKDDLINYKEKIIKELDSMLDYKSKLKYQIKKDDVDKEQIRISIDKINNKSKSLRNKIKTCEKIELRKESLETNLREFEEKEVDKNEPIK